MFFHLLLLVTSSFAREFDSAVRSQNLERIEYINSQQSQWKAGFNFREDITLEELKAMAGGLRDPAEYQFERMTKSKLASIEEIPDSFDAREQWPNCESIQNIRSQGSCDSCWAFASTEAISDRICIHSNAAIQVLLSPQDVIDCCTDCAVGAGCSPGYAGKAWNYWKTSGIVSGGDYKSDYGCKPYSMEAYVNGIANSCSATCTNSDATAERYYGEEIYRVPSDVASIQTEIMTNGPVQTYIDIYDDLYNYKQGVYSRVSEKKVGGHFLKVLGWGVENGIPYWFCANSWGDDFGNLGGFVKVRRGVNEINIETEIWGGIPNF